MKKILGFAERVFTVLALLLFSGALVSILSRQSSQAEGNFLFQALAFIVYVSSVSLLAIRWRGFTRLPKNFFQPVLLLVGFAITSYFWSEVPSITLRRSVALLGTTIFGIYFGTRYTAKQQLYLLAWAFGIGGLLSVIFALALPSYGIDFGSTSWRGVYLQKNILGRVMTISSIVFTLLALSSCKHRHIWWCGAGLSFSLIVLSESKTSLVTCITLLILIPFYRSFRLKYSHFIPLFIISILTIASLAIWTISEVEAVLTLIGKDVTLTGRTDLWDVVFSMIKQRPWLGYGYSGFWLGWDGQYSAYIWQVFSWLPAHAHSGILDLWLDIGLIGIILFVIIFLRMAVNAVSLAQRGQTDISIWPLLFISVTLLFNVTYSTILVRNDISWILFVAINFWQYNNYLKFEHAE